MGRVYTNINTLSYIQGRERVYNFSLRYHTIIHSRERTRIQLQSKIPHYHTFKGENAYTTTF